MNVFQKNIATCNICYKKSFTFSFTKMKANYHNRYNRQKIREQMDNKCLTLQDKLKFFCFFLLFRILFAFLLFICFFHFLFNVRVWGVYSPSSPHCFATDCTASIFFMTPSIILYYMYIYRIFKFNTFEELFIFKIYQNRYV